MGDCTTKRVRRRVQIALVVLLLALVGLGCSGRVWPGPKYPFGILFLALYHFVSAMGYALAIGMLRNEPAGKGRFARSLWLAWMLAVPVCLIARFWWGWYVVLGVLCYDTYEHRPRWGELRKKWGGLSAATWLLDLFFIAYILLNRPFFSQ